MKKLLKIGGVSVLAIVATTAANAAGYTCEEDIVYESCNPGFYISYNGVSCPSGYTYRTNVGLDSTEGYVSFDCSDCETFYGDVCVLDSVDGGLTQSPPENVEWFVQATNANGKCNECPAGYTCDGGTSQPYVSGCSEGSYWAHKTSGDAICPNGYTPYFNGLCWYNYEEQPAPSRTTPEQCEKDDEYYTWISGVVCAREGDGGANTGDYISVTMADYACALCPAGSICSGDYALPTKCPEGKYCAGTGLSQPTGLCKAGSYSTGGAKTADCTLCPATGLFDSNDNPITATSAAGATGMSACYVESGVLIKDIKGTYKYTKNCEYGKFPDYSALVISSAEQCEDMGWAVEDEGCYVYGDDTVIPNTEEACYDASGDNWDGETCECMYSWGFRWDEPGIKCMP